MNIEIGSGKGNFIINLAKQNSNQNYIAIEKKHFYCNYTIKKNSFWVIRIICWNNWISVRTNFKLFFIAIIN
ncbi:hypothetical protein [Spiroplasma endosymbiont of Dactylopius coccus]